MKSPLIVTNTEAARKELAKVKARAPYQLGVKWAVEYAERLERGIIVAEKTNA